MSKLSNMGDMGDMGNLGYVGAGGVGTSVLPDRVNLPFNTASARTWNKDTRAWEPHRHVDKSTGDKVTTGELANVPTIDNKWRNRDWQGRWAAWLVVAEYAATDWRDSITLTPSAEDKVNEELDALSRAAQDERADALGEIVAQNASYEDIMAYFLALLRITPNSHPKMAQLLHVAGLAGILNSMYFKQNPAEGRTARVRPSQLRPALMPPVDIPGHPSFPSGHATQAMLMALCIEKALPATEKEQWQPFLQTLAGRVARNREIAGLHYSSDSEAGFELANKVIAKLSTCGSFNALIDNAGREWSDYA